MKIIVVGDNHSDADVLEIIKNANPDADLFLHAGDSEMTGQQLMPFLSVKGNRDFCEKFPDYLNIDTPCGSIHLCHGNFLFGIKMEKVKSTKCKIFIHGHTHRHYLMEKEGIYICSPGSTSFPRDDTNGTYLIINIINKIPQFEFKKL